MSDTFIYKCNHGESSTTSTFKSVNTSTVFIKGYAQRKLRCQDNFGQLVWLSKASSPSAENNDKTPTHVSMMCEKVLLQSPFESGIDAMRRVPIFAFHSLSHALRDGIHLSGTKENGATWWDGTDKAMHLLSFKIFVHLLAVLFISGLVTYFASFSLHFALYLTIIRWRRSEYCRIIPETKSRGLVNNIYWAWGA